ncbi:MAG: efflux RND transporter periplasmic adaptor subunit [Proteobacteria bacterium]|nr:efflux RND transporter periplasmic adaptor subunit [Pseudomonadota bacterium]
MNTSIVTQSIWGVQAVLIAVLCMSGCTENNPGDEESKKVFAVDVVEVETGTLVDRLGYTGDIEGETEIRVFSHIPDQIVSLNVREGDRVKAGHILATIRSDTLADSVRQATGGLDAAVAQRRSLTDQVTRMQKLKGSGAVSSSQLLTLESQLAAAEAQVRQLEATVSQARQRRGDAVIRAPIDGIIGQLFLAAGDMALPQFPICTVVDMDRVRIVARVPENDLSKLRPAQPVVYNMAANPSAFRGAVVSRISPVLDRLSRTATLEVDIENADHVLKPGMLVHVNVEVDRLENVVWAPTDALTITIEQKDDQNLYRAVVVEDGKAVERMVVVGLEDGARIQVIEGLAAGDKLVVQGQHLLKDGDPVRVVSAAGKSGAAQDAGIDTEKQEDDLPSSRSKG